MYAEYEIENGVLIKYRGGSVAMVPEGVEKIGDSAFAYSFELERAVLPKSLKEISDNAFGECQRLKSVELSGELKIIGDCAFTGCQGLESINLPSSIEKIGENAFYDCRSLESISLTENLKSVGSSAFCFCKGLEKIFIPAGLESIGIAAFSGCEKLKSIESDENNPCYSSHSGALFNKDMSKIIICPEAAEGDFILPESCLEIERNAFYGCGKLKSITLSQKIKVIRDSAFSGCSGPEKIKLPEGLEKIENNAFSGCAGLKEINLPEGLKKIGDYAFCGCRSLKSVIIPASVNNIGRAAFGDCRGIERMEMPDSLAETVEISEIADADSLILSFLQKPGRFPGLLGEKIKSTAAGNIFIPAEHFCKKDEPEGLKALIELKGNLGAEDKKRLIRIASLYDCPRVLEFLNGLISENSPPL